MSIIKPMLKLVQIGVQMLDAHPMIGTLKKAPHVLRAVGVNIAANPFFSKLSGMMITPGMG